MMKQDLANMDVVYILGKGSRWFDNELRFSLRSVVENLPHRRIVVVGEHPKWMQKVLHIPAVDDRDCKLKNAISKLRVACQTPGLSDDFVLMNDDFFLLKPVKEIANFVNGTLEHMEETHETKRGYYHQAIKVTRTMLRFADIKNPLNFELHVPMVMNRKKFLNLTDTILWKEKSYLFRSIYGNVFNLPSTDRSDVKLFRAKKLYECDKMDMISTDNPTVLSPEFQRYIRAKFPRPSKYET